MKQPLKKIDSEKEYWERHSEFMKEKQQIFRKAFKYLTNPKGFVGLYDALLMESEFIGLFPPEYCQDQRERLYNVLNKPESLKSWINENRKQFKKQAKQFVLGNRHGIKKLKKGEYENEKE